jgi:sugar phosphate isomerase/epimerase
MLKTLAPGAIGIQGRSLAEAIDLAKTAGFDAVTFDVRETERLAEERGDEYVRDLFARSGVRPGYWNVPVGWRQDDRWQTDLEQLPRLAASAQRLGCPLASTGVMPGSDERDFADNFAWHASRLRPVAAALRDAGCRLGIEFIGPKTFRAPFRHEFVYNLGGMMELARAIGTGNVGVLLDAWHLYTSGGSIADLDGLSSDDVVVVHVNDAPAGIPRDEQIDNVRELPMATGVIDLVGFMRKLQAIGFAGPVMPEPFNAQLNELAASDPVAAAREAGASMDRLWEAAGVSQAV